MASKPGIRHPNTFGPQGRYPILELSPARPYFSPELESLQMSCISVGKECSNQPMGRDPIWEFVNKRWRNAINGKHRCQGNRHQNLAFLVDVFESAYLITKKTASKIHTLTILSVTKPRPRPGNLAGMTPLISTP